MRKAQPEGPGRSGSGVGAASAAGGSGSPSTSGRGDGGRQPAVARPMDIQMKKREKDSEWHLMSQIKVCPAALRLPLREWDRAARESPMRCARPQAAASPAAPCGPLPGTLASHRGIAGLCSPLIGAPPARTARPALHPRLSLSPSPSFLPHALPFDAS
jgi:hypothetical protein